MATIYDVAKQAGVSATTVSNAFNRPGEMKPETHARILEIARQLDYRPNAAAQALARGKSLIVGLLVSDIRVPVVSNLARGVEDSLTQAGYVPVIASTDGDAGKTLALLDKLQNHGACGYIVMPAQYGLATEVINRLEELHQKGTPTVVTGHDLRTNRINNFTMGAQEAARDLTQHLIDLGHRDIAFITAYYSKGYALRRWLGFQEAMLGNQIPIYPELVAEVDYLPEASYEAMVWIMEGERRPTAVFAMNDIFARGVIDYVTKHQIKVPEELSIVTFDYQALAQRTTPRMTSIIIPVYELGCKSAEMFIEVLKNPTEKARFETLEYTLDVRETTAPPLKIGVIGD